MIVAVPVGVEVAVAVGERVSVAVKVTVAVEVGGTLTISVKSNHAANPCSHPKSVGRKNPQSNPLRIPSS